jgi:PKD repeat protein
VSALSRRYRLVAQALVAAAAVAFMSPACSDDEIGNVTVLAEPTEGEAPLTVEFLARTGGEDIGFTYQWDFGDGSTSEEQDPTHTYTEPGEYYVDLDVRGRTAGGTARP